MFQVTDKDRKDDDSAVLLSIEMVLTSTDLDRLAFLAQANGNVNGRVPTMQSILRATLRSVAAVMEKQLAFKPTDKGVN